MKTAPHKDPRRPATSGLPDGVFAAALTAMRADLSVDHATCLAHCRWLLAHGCDGVAPMGTTGEANSLSVGERTELLDALIHGGVPPYRILVGTGCCAAPDTIALTRHAIGRGVGGVLMLPPFYYKNVSEDGIFASYSHIIDSVADESLRVYLYHFPQLSGVPIHAPLIERLVTAYPGIVVGMKDSGGDWDHMRDVCTRIPGFRLYAGSEAFLVQALRAGGAGCISATTNITGPGAGRLYAAWLDGEDVETLQRELTTQRKAIEPYSLIAALKHLTMLRTGLDHWRHMRPPNMPLPAADASQLEQAARSAGVFDH